MLLHALIFIKAHASVYVLIPIRAFGLVTVSSPFSSAISRRQYVRLIGLLFIASAVIAGLFVMIGPATNLREAINAGNLGFACLIVGTPFLIFGEKSRPYLPLPRPEAALQSPGEPLDPPKHSLEEIQGKARWSAIKQVADGVVQFKGRKTFRQTVQMVSVLVIIFLVFSWTLDQRAADQMLLIGGTLLLVACVAFLYHRTGPNDLTLDFNMCVAVWNHGGMFDPKEETWPLTAIESLLVTLYPDSDTYWITITSRKFSKLANFSYEVAQFSSEQDAHECKIHLLRFFRENGYRFVSGRLSRVEKDQPWDVSQGI